MYSPPNSISLQRSCQEESPCKEIVSMCLHLAEKRPTTGSMTTTGDSRGWKTGGVTNFIVGGQVVYPFKAAVEWSKMVPLHMPFPVLVQITLQVGLQVPTGTSSWSLTTMKHLSLLLQILSLNSMNLVNCDVTSWSSTQTFASGVVRYRTVPYRYRYHICAIEMTLNWHYWH